MIPAILKMTVPITAFSMGSPDLASTEGIQFVSKYTMTKLEKSARLRRTVPFLRFRLNKSEIRDAEICVSRRTKLSCAVNCCPGDSFVKVRAMISGERLANVRNRMDSGKTK